MRRAVRRARPETDSDLIHRLMHVSCHVNQAWRRRQEVARGGGHLRRHPQGLPCGDPTCGAEGTRASGAIHWTPPRLLQLLWRRGDGHQRRHPVGPLRQRFCRLTRCPWDATNESPARLPASLP